MFSCNRSRNVGHEGFCCIFASLCIATLLYVYGGFKQAIFRLPLVDIDSRTEVVGAVRTNENILKNLLGEVDSGDFRL